MANVSPVVRNWLAFLVNLSRCFVKSAGSANKARSAPRTAPHSFKEPLVLMKHLQGCCLSRMGTLCLSLSLLWLVLGLPVKLMRIFPAQNSRENSLSNQAYCNSARCPLQELPRGVFVRPTGLPTSSSLDSTRATSQCSLWTYMRDWHCVFKAL